MLKFSSCILLPELETKSPQQQPPPKSFSASKNEGFSGTFEPPRLLPELDTRNLASSSTVQQLFIESDEDEEEDNIVVEEEKTKTKVAEEESLKPMKEHMDLDSQAKKSSDRDLKEMDGIEQEQVEVTKEADDEQQDKNETLDNSTNPLHFNLIISHFSRKNFPFLALTSLSFMHTNGISLDTYALCSTLTASSKLKDLNFGKQIHAHVGKSDAALMFDEIPEKNTVCANALLSGYCETGLWVKGIELVRKMPVLKLKFDHFTLSAALRACTGLSSIEMGRQLHSYLLRTMSDIVNDVFLQSALVEMYGKCEMVAKAQLVFKLDGMEVRNERSRDVVLWTSMLGVYGKNGRYKEVIDLFSEMLEEGINPDGIAFLTVISACGHTGQVHAGVKYFESMTNDFKLNPGPEHYSCLVDSLCRAVELHKAWEILNERHNKDIGNRSVSMWGALLSACVESGNIELAKLVAQRALELDPQNAGICVMLSNLYAQFGMWDEIGRLRVSIKQRRLRKDVIEAVVPSRVEALSGEFIKKVSFGWGHALALTEDGKLFGWGYYADGRIGNMGNGNLESSPLDSTATVFSNNAQFTSSDLEVAEKKVLQGMEEENNMPIIWEPRLVDVLDRARLLALKDQAQSIMFGEQAQ